MLSAVVALTKAVEVAAGGGAGVGVLGLEVQAGWRGHVSTVSGRKDSFLFIVGSHF
jgi:hypothetical protein